MPNPGAPGMTDGLVLPSRRPRLAGTLKHRRKPVRRMPDSFVELRDQRDFDGERYGAEPRRQVFDFLPEDGGAAEGFEAGEVVEGLVDPWDGAAEGPLLTTHPDAAAAAQADTKPEGPDD